MKKKTATLLTAAALALMLLSGCGNETPETDSGILMEPPGVILEVKGTENPLTRFGFEWTYIADDGTAVAATADASSPLVSLDQMLDITLKNGAQSATLKFEQAPTSYTVQRWLMEGKSPYTENGALPDGQIVTTNSDTLTLEPGYIYLVDAEYTLENCSGTVEYAFYTNYVTG